MIIYRVITLPVNYYTTGRLLHYRSVIILLDVTHVPQFGINARIRPSRVTS